MSALQTFMLVVDHDKEEAKRIAEGIAHDVETKKVTLIDTVQSLGEYINDEDPVLRGKAISYLTAIIQALSPKCLSRQQIQVLTTFFCDRIEDGGAIDGLQALQGLDRFNKFLATQVAQALFSNFQDLQSRSQTQRFHVYQLLNDLMSNHRGAMRDMGDISLLGVVDIMTGEKDPRNLMIVFSILKVVMVEWDISNHVETLFDSVYNYFPITFRPPPNDPYGITAQDLKGRLQECISSTRHFAPHAIPALLDKLDSTSPNVKKDALNTLIACIQSYDPNTVSKFSITIWEVLKFEIINAQEEFFSESSLKALQIIAKRLSEGVTEVSQELPLAKFLQPIIKECNEQLKEPQNKKAKPAQSILSFVPPIFTLYQEADGIVKQRALLETLNFLFETATTVFGQWATRGGEAAVENPLLEFKDQFSDLYGQALMGAAKEEVSFRVTALKGFLLLSNLRHFFQENEIGLFVQYLDEIILKEESVGRNDLKKEAIAALAEISKHKPRLIVDITFPAFVATLPEEDEGSDALYLPTLETLAQISVERDIFETLFRRLFSKLSVLLQKGATRRNMEQDQSVDLYFDKVVIGLCRDVAASASGKAKNRILNDPTVLDTLGRLCNLLVRSVSIQKQEQVAENVYSLFSTAEEFAPIPFTQTVNADQERTIIISTYLLAGISKDCSNKIPHTNPDMSGLLLDLVHRSVSSTEPAIHQAYLRHLALLVNKFLSKQDVSIAEKLLDSLFQGQDTTSKSLNPATIRTILWLSKALILRLAPTITHIITSLLALVSSPDQQTSAIAAQGFSIILGEDDILSATNGATIRLLCRQRLFTTVIPLISSRIREVNIAGTDDSAATPKAPDHIKSAHLTALAGILSTIPTALVMPELPTLLPLLLQSLDLQTAGSVAVRTATLDTLAVIIRDNGVAVIDQCGHIQSLVTRLLKTTAINIGPGTVSSPRLRVDALKCLNLLATHQVPGAAANARPPPGISPLLPVKTQVLRSLRVVLDDPKRDVRKAAVDARAAWPRGVDDAPEDE
ncbi:hypothetical protein PDIDSM_109 [Penicillium digitatum]|nr:hypothetical protein PDIDSM_109 [Penicillium digitatum]